MHKPMEKVQRSNDPAIKTEIVTISPTIAAAWLDQNNHNRSVSNAVLQKYAYDIAHGKWQLTGDAIRFSKEGGLLDGQHRLMACVRADKPFQSVVIYGLPSDSQDVIDTGKTRSIADVLALKGLANARRIGSALRLLLAYKNGTTSAKWSSLSHSAVIDALYRHPNITKSVSKCHGLPPKMPLAGISFLHYVATFFLDAEAKADVMLSVLQSGIPSYDGDAMHVFRERSLRLQDKAEVRTTTTSTWTLFYAWNMFINDDAMGALRWQKRAVDIASLNRDTL